MTYGWWMWSMRLSHFGAIVRAGPVSAAFVEYVFFQ